MKGTSSCWDEREMEGRKKERNDEKKNNTGRDGRLIFINLSRQPWRGQKVCAKAPPPTKCRSVSCTLHVKTGPMTVHAIFSASLQ